MNVTLHALEPHAVALKAEPALRYVREEMRWQGNDATWARGVVEKEQLLNELVRQQCERWAGRPVGTAR